MSEWKKVKLGDISLCIQPGPFGTQLHNSDYTDKGVPVIMPKDMIDGRVFHDKLEHVSEDTANRISRHKVDVGDIMVARKGDVRKCIYIRESEEGWITGSDCLKMQLNQKICNSKFIYFQLRSPYIGAWLQQVSKGATMPSLNTLLLSNIEIVLPPIPTQNSIAEILSRYDSLIENYQKQIKLLEETAQRLYKEWFVDLHFPGHENTKIVDGVPEGWEKKSVDSIYSIKYGKNLSTKLITADGEFPVYGANGVIGYFDKVNCNEQVVLITSRGNGSGDVLMTYHRNAFITNNSFIVNPLDEYNYCQLPFTYQFLKNANFRSVRTGAAQPQLTNQSIHTVDVVLPQKELIVEYCKRTQMSNDVSIHLRNQIRLLIEARDRLLPKLMSGEITV